MPRASSKTVAGKALGIVEVLEQILLDTAVSDLVVCFHVSLHWQDTITGSTSLKRALFMIDDLPVISTKQIHEFRVLSRGGTAWDLNVEVNTWQPTDAFIHLNPMLTTLFDVAAPWCTRSDLRLTLHGTWPNSLTMNDINDTTVSRTQFWRSICLTSPPTRATVLKVRARHFSGSFQPRLSANAGMSHESVVTIGYLFHHLRKLRHDSRGNELLIEITI